SLDCRVFQLHMSAFKQSRCLIFIKGQLKSQQISAYTGVWFYEILIMVFKNRKALQAFPRL
ncbi:MAG: hypothetical protein LBQ51_04115, partial [Desulfovibrio sp.]|nr:hypothetical protein [Desulfovibrio sp.]